MDIIDKVVGAVDRVADVISGEAKIYKSLRGKGLISKVFAADGVRAEGSRSSHSINRCSNGFRLGLGIEKEALKEILAVDDEETKTGNSRFSSLTEGNSFYFINTRKGN